MVEWIQNNPVLAGVIATITLGVLGVAIRYAFKFGKWKGEVDSDRTSFNDFMVEIRDDIKRILERLPPKVEASGSPIRLTELGRKVSKELGAVELAQGLADTIRARVEGKDEYDLQEACLHFAENEYDPGPDVDSRIKKVAYDNGIERRQALRVIGLELRDILSA